MQKNLRFNILKPIDHIVVECFTRWFSSEYTKTVQKYYCKTLKYNDYLFHTKSGAYIPPYTSQFSINNHDSNQCDFLVKLQLKLNFYYKFYDAYNKTNVLRNFQLINVRDITVIFMMITKEKHLIKSHHAVTNGYEINNIYVKKKMIIQIILFLTQCDVIHIQFFFSVIVLSTKWIK